MTLVTTAPLASAMAAAVMEEAAMEAMAAMAAAATAAVAAATAAAMAAVAMAAARSTRAPGIGGTMRSIVAKELSSPPRWTPTGAPSTSSAMHAA